MDLISVIVPIYKVEAYLDRCIRSIVDQTYENLEIILVDDGSPDNCGAICDAWAEKDSRIKVIHKENGGLSDARNAGMAVASGELISFVDSDDTIAPDFLEALCRAMETHGADVAECGIAYVEEDGQVSRRWNGAETDVMDKPEVLLRLVEENGVSQTVWNKLYRRAVAADIPFAVGKCNEDEFWLYRVLDRIGRLAVVRRPLYNYLQRSSSIIGVGYNIRRLDGLQARFERMMYLQKYEHLAAVTRQQTLMNCLWHYQSASRLLEGAQREEALATILDIMNRTRALPAKQLTGSLRNRIWLRLFCAAPDATVWIRNRIRLGM